MPEKQPWEFHDETITQPILWKSTFENEIFCVKEFSFIHFDLKNGYKNNLRIILKNHAEKSILQPNGRAMPKALE